MLIPAASIAQWLYARLNELFSWLFSLGFSGKLRWITRDWPAFVIGIVLFGLLVDVLVYFVRYRPHKKWLLLASRLYRARPWAAKGDAAKKAPPPSAIDVPPPGPARPPDAPRAIPPPRQRPRGADRYQPAPPLASYDEEPRTYEPAKTTPDWRRGDPQDKR